MWPPRDTCRLRNAISLCKQCLNLDLRDKASHNRNERGVVFRVLELTGLTLRSLLAHITSLLSASPSHSQERLSRASPVGASRHAGGGTWCLWDVT
ncbi:hypothetical protein E2C01_032131 [Portunus trituberculatus]|uniref:Uncharacterized protein n=1 Tax=Portunus trituberculatus TaxID=210409 RepID=A0A5B7EUK6_PORTR|nr:hypothetical protein [Portunus trituberculatus]